ncbi:hypothetical protein C8Q79DRAFT_1005316 [Trametes meyenii]|nr:hypothetical protein C8Q79DRAFT_1005316 [Trametes meyenii]
MILNSRFYPHDHDQYDQDAPPQPVPRNPFSQAPLAFPPSLPSAFHQQSFQPAYPLQPSAFPHQIPPFMLHPYPPHPRPIPQALLDDPAFSPDPRANPYFFSMNDREEIYPASVADSLSDYASTAPDDESEVDHTNLPPRLRLALSPEQARIPLPHHARSQSEPYPPIAPPVQDPARSRTTRVIPVPPPISRTSTPGSHLRKPSPEDPRQNAPGPSPIYASASLSARDIWQPPPPYSDSDSASSSSSSPQTPVSSSSHLPRDAQRSSTSLPPASAYPAEKPSPTTLLPPPSGQSSASAQARPPPPATPAPAHKTSTVQSAAVRPPITPRNASAPELHEPPPPMDVPPRPSTVPIATPPNPPVSAPVAQRKRSKNPSIAAAPRDLDRIDELDESDPLGFAWHHDGPYEAIAKAASTGFPDQSAAAQKRGEPPKRKPVHYDSTSLGISPGQIFPSNSQYQPPAQNANVPQQGDAWGPENIPPGSMPSSPLMQVPVQRRVPPSGQLPTSPLMYNNMHMTLSAIQPQTRDAPVSEQQGSASRGPQPAPLQSQRPRAEEPPLESPPLPNPYSPAEARFPEAQDRRNSPPHARAPSVAPSHREIPPNNVVPRPDIALPPQQSAPSKSNGSLLPRHLPKRLVMPAPLQPMQQQNQQLPPEDPRGPAHLEVLARRHTNHLHRSNPPPPPSVRSGMPGMQSQPSQQREQREQQQQQQPHHARAQDIPMSHGPRLLRKRHTTGGALPLPLPVPLPAPGEIPASNTTAALFAARVRFADPPREETKEERKRREKEEARRAKEREKAEREWARARAKDKDKDKNRDRGRAPSEVGLGMGPGQAGPPGGVFARDSVKEAELAREREFAKATASLKASSSRKLSKRR